MVVRPEDKRAKKKAKRLANPTRQGYSSILSNANANRDSSPASDTPQPSSADTTNNNNNNNNVEAEAVAKAIGLNEEAFGAWRGFSKEDIVGVPLSKVATAKSDAATEDSPSPTGPLVIDEWEMEDIPEIERLGSPVVSEPIIEEVEKTVPLGDGGKETQAGTRKAEQAGGEPTEETEDPLPPEKKGEQRQAETRITEQMGSKPVNETGDLSLADKPMNATAAEQVVESERQKAGGHADATEQPEVGKEGPEGDVETMENRV